MDKVRLICRMCLQCNDLINIFSPSIKNSGLWTRINVHLGQEVSDYDDLPEFICLQCIKIICDFDLYCIRVTENQEFLRKNFTVIKLEDEPEEIAENQTVVVAHAEIFANAEVVVNRSATAINSVVPLKASEDKPAGDDDKISDSSSVCEVTPNDIESHAVEEDDSLDEEISCDESKDNEAFHKYSDKSERNIPEHLRSIIEQYPRIIMKDGKYTVRRMQLVDMVRNFYILQCQLCTGKSRVRHKTINGLFGHYRRWHKVPGYVTCCDRKFRKRTEVVFHMIWHLQPSAFRCSICGKRVADPTNLVGHMKCHEGKEGKHDQEVRCDECGIKVLSEHFLQIHKIKVHDTEFEFKDRDINEPHPDFEGFPRSIMKNGEVAIRGERLTKLINKFYRFVCDICSESETFDSFTSLLEHFRSVHNTKGYAMCCGTKIDRRMRLVHHLAQHLDPEAFKCPVCGKLCSRPGKLKDHLMIHKPMEERAYFCTQCPKRYSSHLGLEKHMIGHLPIEERKQFPCDTCGKIFYHRTSLDCHIRGAHTIENLICHICGKALKSIWAYKSHLTVHNPERAPRKTTTAIRKRRTHSLTTRKLPEKNSRPTLEEWRVCPYCSQTFLTKKLLLEHTEIEHNFLHKCKHCNYSNAKFELYFRHLNQQHLLKRNFVCNLCEATFEYSYKLKYHMNNHTREKKYTCQFCNKVYLSLSGFCRHGRENHAEEYKQLKKQRKEMRKSKKIQPKEEEEEEDEEEKEPTDNADLSVQQQEAKEEPSYELDFSIESIETKEEPSDGIDYSVFE